MSELHDLSPVITVDWKAVETALGTELGRDLKQVIEHVGDANPSTLDKWGYAADATPALAGAVKDSGRVIHPDRGPLDARYAPLGLMGVSVDVLRALRGDDQHVGTIIEDGPDEVYLDGLADLYDAARELDDRRDDWHDGEHPRIRTGSHGPDRFGDHYIRVGHENRAIIETLDLSTLPIEREHVLVRGQWRSDPNEEHYTASLRHERYYPTDQANHREGADE